MELEQAIDLVREDVSRGVGLWFPLRDELEITMAGNVEGTDFVTVRWVHRGENRDGSTDSGGDNPFLGLARTGAPIDVHGVTLVEDRGSDAPLFHRYVDWVGVYDQLGLAVSGRMVVSEHPGEIRVPDDDLD